MIVNKLTVGKMTVDKTIVGKMPIDKMTCCPVQCWYFTVSIKYNLVFYWTEP
jgi:hypothetical protein